MYSQCLIILWALATYPIPRSHGFNLATQITRAPASLARHWQNASFNNNCDQSTLDSFYIDIKRYSNVNRSPNVLPTNEEAMPMSIRFDANDNGFFCGAGTCSDVYAGPLLQLCEIKVRAGVGFDKTAATLDCACKCEEYAWCDAFSFFPHAADDCYSCYLHFEGAVTCPSGYTFQAGRDAHVGAVHIQGRKSSYRCYHRETPDKPEYAVGLEPSCRVALDTDAVGIGDPHMTNMNGEHFDIYYAGNHSLIRIPGYGTMAGKFLELSGRVTDFSYLEQVPKCNPHYFDEFDIRGEGLGSVVRNMQVRRDNAGVSFDVVMVDSNNSLLNQSLNSQTAFPSSMMFGVAKVSFKTRRKLALLTFEIQSDPLITVKVDWFKNHPRKPGLNILVHGLTHKLAHNMGAIGGLFGTDSHRDVSSDPGIEGCSNVTKDIKT